jgi:hypothetical protein
MMDSRTPHGYPLFRIMAANAFLLSIIYLVVGTVVEWARRYHPTRFVLRLSLSLDALPARALELTGAMTPLRRAYFYGRLSEFWLRIIFSATTIAIIFVLALLVGLLMGSLRGWLERKALNQSSRRGP